MNLELKKYIVLLLSVFVMMPMMAQKLTGVIVDDNDGEYIPYASAVYRGNHVMVSSNAEGQFSIDRHNGWKLTFSAVGYQPLTVEISANTKNNPAVELMRRVIAAKKKTDLANHDFYQYNKYQKLTLAFNELSPQDVENGIFGKKQWVLDQLELCPYNNKLILPVSVDETVTRNIYRKDPKSEKSIVMGQNTSGLNDLFETGDITRCACFSIRLPVRLPTTPSVSTVII